MNDAASKMIFIAGVLEVVVTMQLLNTVLYAEFPKMFRLVNAIWVVAMMQLLEIIIIAGVLNAVAMMQLLDTVRWFTSF